MPLITAGGTQIIRSFTVSTGAQLVDEISTTLQNCGWVATLVTDGYQLLGQSPQGMQIYLYVRNLGHKFGAFFPTEVTLQFKTTDLSISGEEHELLIDSSWTYQIIASRCQFFICALGVLYDVSGSSVCGGIPWIPFAVGTCSDQVIVDGLPTQAFWCMGDHNDGGSPRRFLIEGGSIFGPHAMTGCEGLWGTDYCAGGNAIGSVRIPTLTTAPLIFGALNQPSPIIYHDDSFITIEPMLIWGTDNTTLPFVRGQIFDAMITSKQFDMDTSRLVDGVTMINFTHQYLYGALHLIGAPPGTAGNYAFTAT